MKKLFLLLTLFGVLAVSCENLDGIINNPQNPNGNTDVNHIFITDSEGDYVVNAEGGEFVLVITTNIEYDVVIPGDAQSWLSVADTRAELRMEKLIFTVAENKTNDERSSVVTLYDKDDNILQKINIIQSAKSNTIANNEIWYTTIDGNKLYPTRTEPSVFGAILVSNTYEDGKGVLVFDVDVTSIGVQAFSDCANLVTITVPESVTTIGGWAFRDCSSLTSVTIPDSVTAIGARAFEDCSSLREFNGKYASEDGRCLIIDGTLNSFAPAGLTEYTIPDSVTSIGKYAFYNCSSLTSVTIPDSVTTIGDYAFEGCSSLTNVTIGDSVTSIGKHAFYSCDSLTSVTIPDSVTTIGDYAFYSCDSLTSVTIPDSVTTIGEDTFYYCRSLTSVTIPDSVTTIGGSAFQGCSSLTSVTIGDSVTTIGGLAFLGCSSLTSVYCEAVTPPTGGSSMFSSNASDLKIYVPMGSVEAYKSASGWSSYKSYIVGYNF